MRSCSPLNAFQQGKILNTYAIMTSPVGSIPPSDIRWKFDLAGGTLMDMTYVLSSTRHALDAGAPVSVVSAKARPFYNDERVDEAMEATLVFRKGSAKGEGEYDVTSRIYADMRRANVGSSFGDAYDGRLSLTLRPGLLVPRLWELPTIEVETELSKVTFYNFMMPHVSLVNLHATEIVVLTCLLSQLYHYIAIQDKTSGKTTYEKHYKGSNRTASHGEEYWSTYRWQLEMFVDKLRGREPVHWVTNEGSIDQMRSIDMVYRKVRLPIASSRTNS
jgi:hypothetical protein